MKIQSLEIAGFRNLSTVSLSPAPSLNGFWGDNGQGKTNLLEAIFGCLRGKSFRSYSGRNDWIKDDNPENATHLKLTLEDSRLFTMECELQRPAGGRWAYYLNGKKVASSAISERVPVVVFSPDDHAIIRRGPELRRDLLDEILTDVCPGYGDLLARYGKTLKSRNEVLKKHEQMDIREELRAWTELLGKLAAEVSNLRRDVWENFEKRFLNTCAELFAERQDGLGIQYEPDLSYPQGMENFSTENFVTHIDGMFAADLATGWTHRGPHRDDFKISVLGGDSRSKASQGQARLLALALKWTHADWVRDERGEVPVFLLDDFSSELDAARRARLLSLIQQRSGQLFVTGTERSLVDLDAFSDYTNYNVKTGIFTAF